MMASKSALCAPPAGWDSVIAGDAIVTLDPYTAKRGPRIIAGAATADSTRNLPASMLSRGPALARFSSVTVPRGGGCRSCRGPCP